MTSALIKKFLALLTTATFLFVGYFTAYTMEKKFPFIYSNTFPKKISKLKSKNIPQTGFITSQTSAIMASQTFSSMPSIEEKLETALNQATIKHKIILWGPYHFGMTTNGRCGLCEVSKNISEILDPQTKAVVVSWKSLQDLAKLPSKRRSDQYYVWWTMEGPRHLRIGKNMSLAEYDRFFNLTMTYRRDADIYSPYDSVSSILTHLHAHGSGDPEKDVEELIKSKKRLALWIVSDCRVKKGAKARWKYAKELIKLGMKVDGRGRCFPDKEPVPKDTELMQKLIRKYKFYFAFENNFYCKDYITEKLFSNSFRAGAVPVVMGAKRSDYEWILPPHSFIYVDDFESPSKLLEYLQYLDSNDTAYKEYFSWRKLKPNQTAEYSRKSGLCQLCRVLHGINIDNLYNPKYSELYSHIPLFGYPTRPRVATSIREWYYGTENRECLEEY